MEKDEFIRQRIDEVRQNVRESCAIIGKKPSDIKIMAVTKTVEHKLVNTAIDYGINLLGENRVQEMLSKLPLYKTAEIHFIGHLQKNKVKYIMDSVGMIESVDSVLLMEMINQLAQKSNLTMDILLEVNIASEMTKNGFLPENLGEVLKISSELKGIRLRGIMGIPPVNEGKYWFKKLNELFYEVKQRNDFSDISFLSMGMSNDYQAAILNGANIIRIGSGIFGKREYKK